MSDVWSDMEQALVTPGITRIYVEGTKGVGKTHWGINALGGPGAVVQSTLNEDVSWQELLGHYLPEGDKFNWHDGPFTMAFRNGKPCIINEISRSSQAVQDGLLAILDDPGIAAMTLPSGETIRPGDGFRVIATSNSPFEELPEPLQDRFDANFVVTHPHPKLILYLDELLVGLGKAINNSYGDPNRAVSPRRAIAFCKYRATMEAATAARLAFGSRASDFVTALRAGGVKL